MSDEINEQQPDVEEEGGFMSEMTQPLIIDLGKQRSKKLKQLKKGSGKLWDEVFEVMQEVKDTLGEEVEGKLMVPIIMIYEKKSKRPNIEKLLFPLAKR